MVQLYYSDAEFNAHLVKRGWRTAYLTLFKAIAWLLC